MATTGHESETINVGGLKTTLQKFKTDFVDNSVNTRIENAIKALDSTKSQTAGTDGLALSITETDGKITSISGSIASGTYDAAGAASTAKTEVIGGATSDGNTLKKLEDRVSPLEIAVGSGGSIDTRITNAINALDSSASQSAGADGLALSITETNGKITSISGSIASGTYDAAGSASAAQSAAATDATTKVNAAKSEIRGNATSACDTLGEAEAKINANTTAISNEVTARANAVSAEASRAQAKEQLLQEQYNALTQSDIIIGTLPSSGTKNKIYRVPGTSSYSDYMWNGSSFVKMAEYNNAIDNEPTPMSNNLVKSGSVYGRLNFNSKDLFCYKNYSYNQNGVREYWFGWNCTSLIPIKSIFTPDGNIRILEGGLDGSTSSHLKAIAFFNSSFVFISGIEDSASLSSVIPASIIPTNAEYIAFSGFQRNVLVLDGLGTIPLYKQNVILPSNLVEFHNYAYVDGKWRSSDDRISTKYPVSFRTDTIISTEINPNSKIIMFNVSDEDNSLTLSPQTSSGWSTGKFLMNANQRVYITVAYSDNSAISPSVVDTMFKLFDANDNKLNATAINTSELFGDNIYFNNLNWYHIAWRGDLNQWQQNRQDIITSEAIYIEDDIKIFVNPGFEAIILETDSTGETVYNSSMVWVSKCYEINKNRYIRIEFQYKGNTGSTNIDPSIANTCGYIEHKSLRQDVKEVKSVINNFDLNLVKKVAYSKKYIICSQWNVGQFGGGNPRSTITAANYNQMAPLWNKEVAEQYANLCGLIEYNPIFGENTEHQNVSPDDIVWNGYTYKEVRRIEPAQSDWYGGCAINTMFPLSNTQKVLYSCFEGDEFPDYTKKSFYTLSEMTYMGVKVKVAECSCPFNMGGPYSDNTFQRLVYQELANTFANEEFVILMGDFELVNNNDYNIFTNAGYTLANGGDFGWFPTCPDSATLVPGINALDNIIVKGFNIIDVEMSLSPLSDHYPLIAILDIKDN